MTEDDEKPDLVTPRAGRDMSHGLAGAPVGDGLRAHLMPMFVRSGLAALLVNKLLLRLAG